MPNPMRVLLKMKCRHNITDLDAECPLLTKLRQQHMLNDKQDLPNTYLFMNKMQLKIISKSLYNINDALINMGAL